VDQIVPRVLNFEQFELDHTRGCVRVDGCDVELRPKAFDLLCYLAENAGRLVSKQELHDAVWGRVAVSDDALVQCIRELRLKLGDDDRSLIRTVARRGYLLDAVRRSTPLSPIEMRDPSGAPAAAAPWYRGELGRLAAAMIVVALALGSIPLARFMRPADLVSLADTRQLAKLATEKELPVPAFHITSLAQDVPDPMRRFIGVWMSEAGWTYSERQFMVIVTSVTRHGDVTGYMVNGPSKPHSRFQGPASVMPFKGYMNAGALRYDGYVGMYLAALNGDGDLELKLILKDGTINEVRLKPVWALPKIPGSNAVASLQ
jgi:DNA-binding winged helix-turn-helix (wHTH) protein